MTLHDRILPYLVQMGNQLSLWQARNYRTIPRIGIEDLRFELVEQARGCSGWWQAFDVEIKARIRRMV